MPCSGNFRYVGIDISHFFCRVGKVGLRQGRYKAKKSGRRTIIIFASVKEDMANLPDAVFAPPRNRKPPVDPRAPTDSVKAAPPTPRPRQRHQLTEAVPT
jgi:hypothetical protein